MSLPPPGLDCTAGPGPAASMAHALALISMAGAGLQSDNGHIFCIYQSCEKPEPQLQGQRGGRGPRGLGCWAGWLWTRPRHVPLRPKRPCPTAHVSDLALGTILGLSQVHLEYLSWSAATAHLRQSFQLAFSLWTGKLLTYKRR